MKRINAVLIVALVSLMLPLAARADSVPVPAPQFAPHIDGIPGVVLVARLHVRRAPRLSSSVIGTLTPDTPFKVIGRTLGAVWAQVTTPFGVGWVDREFIRFDGTVRDLPVTDVIPPFLTVSGQPSVNVRIGPNEIYPIITRIPAGLEVDVTATHRRSSWYRVAMPDGTVGWVRSDTVIVNGDVSHLPDLPAEPVVAEVTSYRVNVHAEPGLDSPVVGTAIFRQFYEVSGADSRGNWWLIEGEWGEGWILSAFVKVYGDIETLPVTNTDPIGKR